MSEAITQTPLTSNGLYAYDFELYNETITKNPYIPFSLYPKQKLVALLSCRDHLGVNHVLTGGAAGGGKTMLLAALALQFMTEPEYRCLVTRRGYRELVGTGSVYDIIKNIPGLKSRESSPIKVVSPSGAEIHFKAFQDETHKQDVKGESYHTILNDEASELNESVLRFLNRSVRKSSDDPIPLRVVNASNPGGDSTEYLINKFITGPSPYVSMGYKDNPYIDDKVYEASLLELDYIDRQYQMRGDWFYKPSQGDLMTREAAESQYITGITTPVAYELMSIDLAGKGRDFFAVCCYDYLANGWEYIRDFDQTRTSNPENMLLNFIYKHNPDKRVPLTSVIVIEQEGGGSPEYARKYFQNLILEAGYNIPIILEKPMGNKYQRARPLMHSITYGGTKLNKDCRLMDDFIDESIQLDPLGKGRSPNLVDSASLGRNYLHTRVLGKGTRIHKGNRIG